MSESKHTPGPWNFRRAWHPTDGEFDFGISAIIDGRQCCIAEAFGRVAKDIRPDAEANARLIAAAPDLLEACKAALAMVDTDRGPPNWDQLRAAIAKATTP